MMVKRLIYFIKLLCQKEARKVAKYHRLKKLHLQRCTHIEENMNARIDRNKKKIHNELEEEKKKTDILCEDKILKAHQYAESVVHDAVVRAQDTLTQAAKLGDVMTIELYKKDIYGRPFFRLAPLLDAEGYEKLRKGEGEMKFKLVYPDGSRQVVRAIPYDV